MAPGRETSAKLLGARIFVATVSVGVGVSVAATFLFGWLPARRLQWGTIKRSLFANKVPEKMSITNEHAEADDLAAHFVEGIVQLVRQLPCKPLISRDEKSAARIILMCASGKGGVGKSSIAVNLAFAFRQLGLTVGLLDLDIYGPSIPELVRVPDGSLMQNGSGRLLPIEYGGVKLMSWGYVSRGQAATVRAPIIMQLTQQLLTDVVWGSMDVLLIDTPPGTGDVLLTLSQTFSVDGAVLLTTGNTLSLADLAKGMEFLDKVSIPPLVVVHNMAFHCCERCGHEETLFEDTEGMGLAETLKGRSVVVRRLPLDPLLSQAPGDPSSASSQQYPFMENPLCKSRPAWKGLRRMAVDILQILLGTTTGGSGGVLQRKIVATASMKLRRGGQLELRLGGGELRSVACGEIRAQCRCAECVDDLTGQVKIDRDFVRADRSLHAKSVEPVGNYAVRVLFSDGHSVITAFRAAEDLSSTCVDAPARVASRASGSATRADSSW
eukprot:TRINITY_DN16941_c0_g1_i1.p1 TRINITY_DN16941_c0_g1~~TRINITY_DN16941_c0_g1_i1.p1  ORF type:complete len:517 (+),score=73.61 TRINITY_DN16941_c0_g1_i1:64-1551(+)